MVAGQLPVPVRGAGGPIKLKDFCFLCRVFNAVCPSMSDDARRDKARHVDGAPLRWLALIARHTTVRDMFASWFRRLAPQADVPQALQVPVYWERLLPWIEWAFQRTTQMHNLVRVHNIVLAILFVAQLGVSISAQPPWSKLLKKPTK
jgi:hypothetical protein